MEGTNRAWNFQEYGINYNQTKTVLISGLIIWTKKELIGQPNIYIPDLRKRGGEAYTMPHGWK